MGGGCAGQNALVSSGTVAAMRRAAPEPLLRSGGEPLVCEHRPGPEQSLRLVLRTAGARARQSVLEECARELALAVAELEPVRLELSRARATRPHFLARG